VDETNPECTRKVELQATLTAEPFHIHGIPLPHRRQSFAAWLSEKLSVVRVQHL
jgi:hypothetical protein